MTGVSVTVKCSVCGESFVLTGIPAENVQYAKCGPNICDDCEQDGFWIDPAGGVHEPDEEDPAAMYK